MPAVAQGHIGIKSRDAVEELLVPRVVVPIREPGVVKEDSVSWRAKVELTKTAISCG